MSLTCYVTVIQAKSYLSPRDLRPHLAIFPHHQHKARDLSCKLTPSTVPCI
uniref:Uncharacterized protein n=1 Tax=Arundo donax TaxID=35708 RepID=A0A0A9D400_ARUDO